MSEKVENEVSRPRIGEELSALRVIREGEQIEEGVYEVEYDDHTVRAELQHAVITEVSQKMQIESPFPAEGTVTPTEYGYSADLPCASEWLTETETGDYIQQAVDRVAREYGEGVEVRVRWTGRNGVCNGFELLGEVE